MAEKRWFTKGRIQPVEIEVLEYLGADQWIVRHGDREWWERECNLYATRFAAEMAYLEWLEDAYKFIKQMWDGGARETIELLRVIETAIGLTNSKLDKGR